MAPAPQLDTILENILDQARWAPSGDNTQPWRFEIVEARHVVVHGFDTRSHCVYDLDGHPSQLSLGALLESLALAASSHGLRMEARRRLSMPDTLPTFDVHLLDSPGMLPDPLAAFLPRRSVQRRRLGTRRLRASEKAALAASLPPGYGVQWHEGWRARLACARLMFDNAKLRLTMPEAHRVHRDVIEWGARFSNDRIPDQALGVDPMTARLMRWIMQSWRRVDFFNTWLAGTLAPRLQMDLLPGLYCAAHGVLLADAPPRHIDDYVAAGRAMQRFWLTATQLGLQLQPELTPLIFSRYVRERRAFSRTEGMQELAQELAGQCQSVLGAAAFDRAVFLCRIGAGPAARARSLRRPLSELLVTPATAP
ncbi:nitroreductase family protein [Janthinobacterium sp. SUN118]|uniref:nitroreductase family protein n=1 Tax=Janthinobacterium sp. SUN118 TaxID=3004100 RepID=UPI0025B0038F|nr:nitroreductase family protein [Janthinobacterium sp. SUN118]MDN2709290.1 nitroreductase family protein [Janthinobacterium sp. SUN118]